MLTSIKEIKVLANFLSIPMYKGYIVTVVHSVSCNCAIYPNQSRMSTREIFFYNRRPHLPDWSFQHNSAVHASAKSFGRPKNSSRKESFLVKQIYVWPLKNTDRLSTASATGHDVNLISKVLTLVAATDLPELTSLLPPAV